MITRIPVVDDTGDGVSGTPITAAWWDQVQNMIDARWSLTLTAPSGSIINDLNINQADFLMLNPSADMTLSGIVGPTSPDKIGKPLRIRNLGPGNVYLSHADGRSVATSRFYNPVSSGPMPLGVNGAATYCHSGTSGGGGWWLIQHEQGGWIDVPITGMVTPSGPGTMTLQGTLYRYRISGKTLTLAVTANFQIVGSSSSVIYVAFPPPYTATPQNLWQMFRATNAGVYTVGINRNIDGNRLTAYAGLPGDIWNPGTCVAEFMSTIELT